MLGEPGLDEALSRALQVVAEPAVGLADLALGAEDARAVAAFVATSAEPRALWLTGPPASGKRQAAEAIAAELQRPLLCAREERARDARLATRMRLQAVLAGAVLYVERPAEAELEALLCDGPGSILLGLDDERAVHGAEVVRLGVPTTRARRARWHQRAAACQLRIEPSAIERVASRFELGVHQIDAAVELLRRRAAAGLAAPSAAEVMAAARAQCGGAPAFAEEIAPRRGWHDIVLPPHALDQLRALCARIEHREGVLEQWGFGDKLGTGLGTNALFAGPSGTGKTLAAEIVAGELGVPLFRVNLAHVVSKYIGETEKNLQAVFDNAEAAHAALFFDEADALFGKRSAVRDSHDRYANLEISYLLQKMESYRGLAILATNLLQNLDDAFVRRLAFTVHFPFPGVSERESIWRNIWPAQAPLAADVDPAALAVAYKISGGAIRNAAFAAAFLARPAGVIAMRHIEHAIRREFQKLGKRMDPPLLESA
jgi:AAA+ superfamily predicted ATPase